MSLIKASRFLARLRVKQTDLFLRPGRSASSSSSSGSDSEDPKPDDGEKPISRFPIPEVGTLPPDMQEVMKEAKEKAGFLPNVFKTLSHRPEEMRAFVHYYDVVMNGREDGHLTKADRELIIVAVSAFNKCRYCIIAHSALHRIFSKNRILADQVAANWETADLDERRRAILKFAMQVAECKPLTESHFEELYQHGLEKEDAWDIGAVVALFSLSNRMAFLTSMTPNEEFYMLGRVDKPNK
ncbi:alkylhydroperoxidase ahpd core:uncharacterized peroxidase-related protein [Plakobranchus ocellatus]|uniref:Alkylhydroperoxidase ahpd core:uncharacterized peroxidase-related protein n=1 Tax=Plakobranchus ocellatus TaxID=259542 RepID=A0AAV4D1E5_9GAST|nr:alkylhydroperoxidase ahpd core:uncharacterized peroxidase-related protein [Plakobranchus ocellatus]